MTKVALDLRTWVEAWVREPMHAYAGIFLPTQLGFQKHEKCKFFENWLRFGLNPTLSGCHSKPLFLNYKKPYTVLFQKTQKSHGNNLRFTRKQWIKREFFHKTPSSHFYLIGTFSGPNPLSLKFLITVLLNCDRFDWREQ